MSNKVDHSLSIANPHPAYLNNFQKVAAFFAALACIALLLVWFSGGAVPKQPLFLGMTLAFTIACGLWTYGAYNGVPEGIKNNGVRFQSLSSKGAIAWILGIIITAFYVCLYWFPQYIDGLVRMFDPLSMTLRNKPADRWFAYGGFYTLAVLLMGAKFIVKYRHNNYQIIRTISVMFFQLGFAFLLPAFMELMNKPGFFFTYFWPLDSYALRPSTVNGLIDGHGKLGLYLVLFSVGMFFIATPILTYFFGKRWYCSWVCGCGGLAETAGDPFRQLSDKSLKAWKIERWMIHSVLVLVFLMTGLLWYNSYSEGAVLGAFSAKFAKLYGFFIASMFSGVVGVGFYPILGSRVWCRFGCPMAAVLGIYQKFFSRFRITTNGGQCISCGNCSTYCEMGIDVRAYAQKGQNIVRASCVGCGICAAVCPRGVLKLENGPNIGERTEIKPFHIGRDEVGILN